MTYKAQNLEQRPTLGWFEDLNEQGDITNCAYEAIRNQFKDNGYNLVKLIENDSEVLVARGKYLEFVLGEVLEGDSRHVILGEVENPSLLEQEAGKPIRYFSNQLHSTKKITDSFDYA